ncbi:putative quinol monooxygenase [Patulibacter minatonensis]|uniref:putative quinol monooxygenase n=1 Tax=Patulibacter minatonensis TaxID=298163 RepID=UPI00047BD755|nr:antibiotic biosynthesis monooxygenase family protein [Patulibacter minatonensis]
MSITAILEVQFRPDVVEEGIEALGRVLVDTRAFAGNESVVVIQDRTDPTRVAAVEVWESLEADAAYREWRAGDGQPKELAPLLAGAPRLTVGEHLSI